MCRIRPMGFPHRASTTPRTCRLNIFALYVLKQALSSHFGAYGRESSAEVFVWCACASCISEFLIKCCLGAASTGDASLKKSLAVAQESLRQLVGKFFAKPFPRRDLILHTPRKDNGAADAAANHGLDQGNFEEVHRAEVLRFSHSLVASDGEHLGLVFSFDGASRGNPGDASHANCAWWGVWEKDGFLEKGLLFSTGRRLGIQTNNFAEARGMAFAANAALHLRFWLIEHSSQASASRFGDEMRFSV